MMKMDSILSMVTGVNVAENRVLNVPCQIADGVVRSYIGENKMWNTDMRSDRCVVCGKFLKRESSYGKLCPKHKAIEKLIDDASTALFTAEQALYRLEKAHSCLPLYRMRCGLGEVQQRYRNGGKVCEMMTTLELIGRM